MLALVLAAPTSVKQARATGAKLSLLHTRLRTCLRYTSTVTQLLLLAKASAIAVLAPDDVWPVAADPADLGSKPFVGRHLLFTFSAPSLGTSRHLRLTFS
jgi:hypothetical protein